MGQIRESPQPKSTAVEAIVTSQPQQLLLLEVVELACALPGWMTLSPRYNEL